MNWFFMLERPHFLFVIIWGWNLLSAICSIYPIRDGLAYMDKTGTDTQRPRP